MAIKQISHMNASASETVNAELITPVLCNAVPVSIISSTLMENTSLMLVLPLESSP